MEDPELRVLANFVTIARSPSLAAAAKKLGVSQPAITRQIQNLEAKFGAPLLKRRSSGILLTRFGERILTRATEFVSEFEDLVQTAQAKARAQRHELNIGSDFAPFSGVLVSAEVAARNEMPTLKTRIHDLSPRSSIDSLLDHEIDLLVTSQSPTPEHYEQLDAELWMLRGITAIMHSDHPFASRQKLSLADLGGVPVVVPSEAAHPRFLRDLREAFARAKQELIVAQIASTDLTLMNYANYGLGIALVVGLVESLCKDSLVCRPVEGITVSRPRRLEVLWRADDSNGDIHCLKRHLADSLREIVGNTATAAA